MVCWGAIVLEVPLPIHPHVGIPTAQGTAQIRHDLEVNSCTNAQTMLNKFPVHDTVGIEKKQTSMSLVTHRLPWVGGVPPCKPGRCGLLGRRVITEDPGFIPSYDLVGQILIAGSDVQELVADANSSLALLHSEVMQYPSCRMLAQLHNLAETLLDSAKIKVGQGGEVSDGQRVIPIQVQKYLAQFLLHQLDWSTGSGGITAVHNTIFELGHPVINCAVRQGMASMCL